MRGKITAPSRPAAQLLDDHRRTDAAPVRAPWSARRGEAPGARRAVPARAPGADACPWNTSPPGDRRHGPDLRGRARLGRTGRFAFKARVERQRLAPGERRVERHVLGQVAEAPPGETRRPKGPPEDLERARGRPDQAEHQLQERRLAGPVVPTSAIVSPSSSVNETFCTASISPKRFVMFQSARFWSWPVPLGHAWRAGGSRADGCRRRQGGARGTAPAPSG